MAKTCARKFDWIRFCVYLAVGIGLLVVLVPGMHSGITSIPLNLYGDAQNSWQSRLSKSAAERPDLPVTLEAQVKKKKMELELRAREKDRISRERAARLEVCKTILTPEPKTYLACGCGCCGGGSVPEARHEAKCLYRSKGDSIVQIGLDDCMRRSDLRCAVVGCSLRGVLYRYCD